MSETPSEIAVLRAALAAAEARASAAEEELTQTRAVVSASEEMIRHLRLRIAKLRREQFGHSAERRRPARRPFPEHLPRARVVTEAPTSCTRLAGRRAS